MKAPKEDSYRFQPINEALRLLHEPLAVTISEDDDDNFNLSWGKVEVNCSQTMQASHTNNVILKNGRLIDSSNDKRSTISTQNLWKRPITTNGGPTLEENIPLLNESLSTSSPNSVHDRFLLQMHKIKLKQQHDLLAKQHEQQQYEQIQHEEALLMGYIPGYHGEYMGGGMLPSSFPGGLPSSYSTYHHFASSRPYLNIAVSPEEAEYRHLMLQQQHFTSQSVPPQCAEAIYFHQLQEQQLQQYRQQNPHIPVRPKSWN